MIRGKSYYFYHIQRIVDVLTLGLAWGLAYYVRFGFFHQAQEGLSALFFKTFFIIAGFALYFFNKNKLYSANHFNSLYKEMGLLFKANIETLLALILFLYFFFPEKISRIHLIIYLIFSQFLLIGIRLQTRSFLTKLREKRKNLRHVLLIGAGDQIIKYVEIIRVNPASGIDFLGWVDSHGKAAHFNIKDMTDMPLAEIKKQHLPDMIVLGYTGKEFSKNDEIIKSSITDVVPLQFLPDLPYSFIGHRVEDFSGIPLITINDPNLGPTDHLLKRIFDILFSISIIFVLSPIFIFISLLVKLTSPGPILYGQERMSVDGTKFLMWKFRSMRIDAEEKSGAVWARENDPRRTLIGKFLRESSLDELPQFFNVLKGDMSIVGPRPERPIFIEEFRNTIPAYMLRHKLKTGITGWAQVNGYRGNTSLEKRIEYDIYYIKNWSLWFDIKIVFMTLWKGLLSKNAY